MRLSIFVFISMLSMIINCKSSDVQKPVFAPQSFTEYKEGLIDGALIIKAEAKHDSGISGYLRQQMQCEERALKVAKQKASKYNTASVKLVNPTKLYKEFREDNSCRFVFRFM